MNKAYKIIHRSITILSWAMLLISLVCLIIRWKSLPETLGVHFSGTGEFDLYDDKVNAFYPYLVGFGTLIVSELAIWLAKRIKSGLKVNEQGERRVRMVVILWIDIFKCGISVFFTHWSYCVITQSALNVFVVRMVIFTVGAGLILLALATVAIRVINAGKKEW